MLQQTSDKKLPSREAAVERPRKINKLHAVKGNLYLLSNLDDFLPRYVSNRLHKTLTLESHLPQANNYRGCWSAAGSDKGSFQAERTINRDAIALLAAGRRMGRGAIGSLLVRVGGCELVGSRVRAARVPDGLHADAQRDAPAPLRVVYAAERWHQLAASRVHVQVAGFRVER